MSAYDYGLLAQAAYTAVPTIGKPEDAARIILSNSPGGLLLGAPGTNNWACAEADADMLLYDAGEFGTVHRGIWLAFDSVWNDVSKLAPVAVYGHSEGAAGVIYLAARLCSIGKAPKEVWAFEPPRTSIDDKLAMLFMVHGVKVNVFHHGRDIVPLMPLPIPGEPWRHPVPDVIQFGKPSSIWPNVKDHLLENVLPDLELAAV